jgi:protein CpxP
MKKNTILYILLIFLIIVNGVFLFNYLGKDQGESPRGRQTPSDFIVKELEFNKTQLAQFRENSKGHHEAIRGFSDDIKSLKDVLFGKLSDDSINDATLDSVTALIGEKEMQKEREVFSHFKMIQELSNNKQKEKFKNIIKDALHRGDRGNRPPPPEEGHRPPPRNN